MRWPVKIVFDLPVEISRFKLDPVKAEEFNNGDFARIDYKYMFRLTIDKGKDKLYVMVATPSFRQILYSLKTLWHAYEGQPYDRHNHPVVMQCFNVTPLPGDTSEMTAEQRSKAKADFQKAYAKNRNQAVE